MGVPRVGERYRGVEGPAAAGGGDPSVRELEAAIDEGLAAHDLAAVKAWLVACAERLERAPG